ncbi:MULTISPECIES: aldo/keto reductase [unclassified Amycolatopsis]|uniref:aldo/keto reductase n=1 Tax=unclassified Amycolatopsis TaxID=2618356 RepID=UPI001C69E4DF|nr:aldo/keto reductase [Amycolatopsis sp. DSM 110486]QYN20574.1 aldo/keto reductase [Amycolatopsis sp. DSM 110486]
MTGLDDYRPLGRSGLRVSPLALGAMTFGPSGLSSDDATSREVFRTYVGAGGNYVDTADNYSDGRSEELVGEFLREVPDRDELVLATKYSGPRFVDGEPVRDVLGRSNGRKNMIASLERSLRRLGVDHVDLYWLHVWDGFTPAEEVVAAFADLMGAGKVRAVGLSDVPAWYATKAAMLGGPPITAMQLEYSLVERTIETEHLPLAAEFGIAVQPWSALAGGFLTGKYSRDGAGSGRLDGTKHSERRWAVLDAVREVAAETGQTPAQVAMHWVLRRPGIAGTLVGARSARQLTDTLGALALDLPAAVLDRLTEVSAPELPFPHNILARFS